MTSRERGALLTTNGGVRIRNTKIAAGGFVLMILLVLLVNPSCGESPEAKGNRDAIEKYGKGEEDRRVREEKAAKEAAEKQRVKKAEDDKRFENQQTKQRLEKQQDEERRR